MIELKIPTTYEDITLAEYMEMQKSLKGDKKDIQRLVSIACRVDMAILKKLPQKSLKAILSELMWMFETPDLTANEFKPRFWMHGVEYGFIPNVDKITVGEFADLEHFVLKGTYENLPQIMAILYRPVVEGAVNQYAIADYDDYDIDLTKMMDMPVDVAIAAMVFFYNIENRLVHSLQYYLKTEGKHLKSIRNGDGTA